MYQQYNQFRQPGRRRGSRVGGCISGILVFALIVCALLFVFNRAHNGVTVSVGAHPTIIAKNCLGDIIVQAGPANQVTLSGLFPQYKLDSASNTITLNADDNTDTCDGPTTLIVPAESDLTLETDSVTVIGVSGSMDIDVNGGNINLLQSTLENKSTISDNGGPVIFSGKLAPGSTSKFDCNSGSLDLTLPTEASFNVQVSGILGPFISTIPAIQLNPEQSNIPTINVGSNAASTTLKLELNDTGVIMQSGSL